MAFCQKCGTQLQDGVNFCPDCGAQTGAAPAQSPTPQAATPSNDAAENKGMAILAYFLWFVPLLAGAHKTSPFVKYHTNQAIILCIVGVCGAIVSIVPIINFLLIFLYPVLFVLFVMGIINAAQEKTKPLPIIGNLFTILQ
ncbi:MAG: zinc-ribbon domain-containing protein [Peptococcaceae bacterium]|jgi:uncharacterized membrane protein|nr:zinc-ribbon domain-containing protein [Peptococcaceae bacterium]